MNKTEELREALEYARKYYRRRELFADSRDGMYACVAYDMMYEAIKRTPSMAPRNRTGH